MPAIIDAACEVVDEDAVTIGELYAKAKGSIVDSVRYQLECGSRLSFKKQCLGHGKWLPWLAENADVLGFASRRTAHLLMRAARNVKSTSHLDELEALQLSRRLWGNEIAQRLTPPALREPVPAPSGRYDVIVIDPPWPMTKIERDVRPNQLGFDYPTMSEEELAAFGVPGIAAEDCHLFCWTTQKFLPMALRLVEAWGFRYVLTMVWHKRGGFQPVGLPQFNCEFVIYGRMGAPKFIDTIAFNCCFEAPRREHSRKPDEFYDLVRRVTDGSRIDVFSRERREGFAQWGNEVGKFSVSA